MPTYDYQCTACDHTFELFQGINDPVKKKCPQCGKNKLQRLFGTGAAIVFKGSGFYQTDYRSEGYKKAAQAEQKSSEGKASSGGTSGDAQSTAKADTKSESKPAPTESKSPKKSDS